MIRMTKGLVLFTGSFNEVTRKSVRWYKRGGFPPRRLLRISDILYFL